MAKIGRNDPCPCGSGKKYKRCCMDSGRVTTQTKRVDPREQRRDPIPDFAVSMEETDELDEGSAKMAVAALDTADQASSALAEAESSLLVHLELYEWLGSKEGMADAYSNLGRLYQTLGDLAPAEAMYKDALKLDEALGRKEVIAQTYGNLGPIYEKRGDLGQAAAMYKKSIDLFQQLGATPRARQLQELLDELEVGRRQNDRSPGTQRH